MAEVFLTFQQLLALCHGTSMLFNVGVLDVKVCFFLQAFFEILTDNFFHTSMNVTLIHLCD